MTLAGNGYRVAVIGASSLLGKELLAVLKERTFPVSDLVTYEAGDEELGLPILDLQAPSWGISGDALTANPAVDFAFVAARPASESLGASFLRHLLELSETRRANSSAPGGLSGLGVTTGELAERAPWVIIDLDEGVAGETSRALRIPFLDQEGSGRPRDLLTGVEPATYLVAPHSATITISTILLRLASLFALKSVVAQVFSPVSQIGPRAIDELQKQTVSLLGFQKIPKAVFGTQMAFNVLPRIGRRGQSSLSDLECRIRDQLRWYLGDRLVVPPLRVFQVPVFYSLALSIFVEAVDPVAPEKVGRALAGKRIQVRRPSEPAPSQVEAAGTGDILVDSIVRDPASSSGFWIWSVVDNLRLAAQNAVEIAEERLRSTANAE